MKEPEHCLKPTSVAGSLNINVNDPVELDSCDLTLYSAARWTALVRGIDVIEKKAAHLKIDLNKTKMWVKPLALQKYVDEETNHMITAIKVLMENEDQQ